jgi:hypothetical protein
MCRKYYFVMALPAVRRHPACMFRSHLLRHDREFTPRRSRMPVALAGAAVLGMSLLLSVAPVLGAANGNNGNNGGGGAGSSNVKVHDASTGVEALGSDNEPHVCDFWLEFSMPDPYEAGTWVLLSWAPTGDGSTVASGTYDTTGDGTDSSSVIQVAAGHYRVEWTATGESASKKKTFWVDAGCDDAAPPVEEPPAEEVTPPVEEPPAEEVTPPVEEPPAEEVTPPVEEPPAADVTPPVEEPPAADVTPPVEELPVEEPATTGEGSTGEAAPPVDEPATDIGQQDVLSELGASGESTAEEPASPADEEVEQDPAPPSDESLATPVNEPAAEAPAQAEDPGATDPGSPPSQNQLDGQGDAGGSTMPDTATSRHVPGGLAATLSLLLVMVWYTAARRFRLLDRG